MTDLKKIVTSFTHPNLVHNLFDFFPSIEHERRYLRKVGNKTILVPIDFHYIF